MLARGSCRRLVCTEVRSCIWSFGLCKLNERDKSSLGHRHKATIVTRSEQPKDDRLRALRDSCLRFGWLTRSVKDVTLPGFVNSDVCCCDAEGVMYLR